MNNSFIIKSKWSRRRGIPGMAESSQDRETSWLHPFPTFPKDCFLKDTSFMVCLCPGMQLHEWLLSKISYGVRKTVVTAFTVKNGLIFIGYEPVLRVFRLSVHNSSEITTRRSTLCFETLHGLEIERTERARPI